MKDDLPRTQDDLPRTKDETSGAADPSLTDSAFADRSFDALSPALQAAQAAQASAESIADALKTSELRYRRLFETARDGILILDSDQGKITDANLYMTELLGYSHDELLGKQLWEIGLHHNKAAGQEAFRQLKQDHYIRYENLPLENRRGERREVECVSNLYRENGHTVIQCNVRDITERKRTEAQIAALYQRDQRIAAALQRSLLFTPHENAFPGLEVKMLHEPASEEALVGGDFWDIFACANGRVAFVIGDVTGHGLEAAVFTNEIRFTLRAFLHEHERPSVVLNQLNAYLCESHRLFHEGLNREGNELPVCLALAVIHTASGEGQVASAGMEPPLLIRAGGLIETVSVSGLLLGVEADQEYHAASFQLGAGDLLLMTTDGITEARRGPEFLETAGLLRLVHEAQPLGSLEQTSQALLAGARAFSGGSFRDDVCLVMARRQ